MVYQDINLLVSEVISDKNSSVGSECRGLCVVSPLFTCSGLVLTIFT